MNVYQAFMDANDSSKIDSEYHLNAAAIKIIRVSPQNRVDR